ncbi:hypothetical protein Tco_0453829 [Tanacetum coccineum]
MAPCNVTLLLPIIGLTAAAIERLVNQRVANALAAQEANRNNENGGGNGNSNEARNRDEVNGGSGGVAPVARACTYKDFLNCQPRNFSGTERVLGLAKWFEKMEYVFRISKCAISSQVKLATYTLLDGALTWWNSHVQTIGIDEAYEMSWEDLIKLMIEVYCPRSEIQKLEKEDKIERYIWGLPDNIQGNVTSSKLTKLKDAIKMANWLMDQKVRAYAAKNDENKRKWENNPWDNRVHSNEEPMTCSENLYAVSIKEDTAYLCPKLHSASTKERSICRIQKKAILRIQVQVMEYSRI